MRAIIVPVPERSNKWIYNEVLEDCLAHRKYSINAVYHAEVKSK